MAETKATRTRTVHPHGCGERATDSEMLRHNIGSSPRVWGTHAYQHYWHSQHRFIPTGVGNACASARSSSASAVHPHGCGERNSLEVPTALMSGSSPRVWGTRVGRHFYTLTMRFIPTGVGNAPDAQVPPAKNPVHPHGCGERIGADSFVAGGDGSSPRVWGTLIMPIIKPSTCRFIPTGVGNADDR